MNINWIQSSYARCQTLEAQWSEEKWCQIIYEGRVGGGGPGGGLEFSNQ